MNDEECAERAWTLLPVHRRRRQLAPEEVRELTSRPGGNPADLVLPITMPRHKRQAGSESHE